MKIFNIIFCTILGLVYGYLSFLLNDLGLLSNKILLYISIFGAIVILLISFCILKLKSKLIKGFLYFISIIGMLLSIFGIYYLNSTISFIDNFGNTKEKYDYYYVIVLKESKYNSINDLNGLVTLVGFAS